MKECQHKTKQLNVTLVESNDMIDEKEAVIGKLKSDMKELEEELSMNDCMIDTKNKELNEKEGKTMEL